MDPHIETDRSRDSWRSAANSYRVEPILTNMGTASKEIQQAVNTFHFADNGVRSQQTAPAHQAERQLKDEVYACPIHSSPERAVYAV